MQLEPQKVVGTNYSRVIPSKEINSKDRDNFWKKEEEEERIRIETERGKQRDAKLELEKVMIIYGIWFYIFFCGYFRNNWIESSYYLGTKSKRSS